MLVRQVAIKHAVGSSGYRRRTARVTAQVVLWRMMLAASVLGIGVVVLAPTFTTSCTFKPDEARKVVDIYAFEAFPQWALTNHERVCPSSITELTEFSSHEPIDPWGTPLEMQCPHARSFYVRSAGPDRTFGTDDDISSTER